MTDVTDFDGTTAVDWLTRLRKRIAKDRVTGPDYAHNMVIKAHQAEWIMEKTDRGERRYFVVYCGSYMDGRVKRWHVTCKELSEKHQKKTGKRWRIEASLQ